MKMLTAIFVIIMSSIGYAADWKVVVESENCEEKIQILGKIGEKYVVVQRGGAREKLFSEDGSTYNQDSMRKLEFSSDLKDKQLGDPTFTYSHPRMVESTSPRLDIILSGKKVSCRMTIK